MPAARSPRARDPAKAMTHTRLRIPRAKASGRSAAKRPRSDIRLRLVGASSIFTADGGANEPRLLGSATGNVDDCSWPCEPAVDVLGRIRWPSLSILPIKTDVDRRDRLDDQCQLSASPRMRSAGHRLSF